MLTPDTIEKMNAMKLFGLVSAFENQLSSSEYKELSFEERTGLLVDAEWTAREQRKLSRRLRAAPGPSRTSGRRTALTSAARRPAPTRSPRSHTVLRTRSM